MFVHISYFIICSPSISVTSTPPTFEYIHRLSRKIFTLCLTDTAINEIHSSSSEKHIHNVTQSLTDTHSPGFEVFL